MLWSLVCLFLSVALGISGEKYLLGCCFQKALEADHLKVCNEKNPKKFSNRCKYIPSKYTFIFLQKPLWNVFTKNLKQKSPELVRPRMIGCDRLFPVASCFQWPPDEACHARPALFASSRDSFKREHVDIVDDTRHSWVEICAGGFWRRRNIV